MATFAVLFSALQARFFKDAVWQSLYQLLSDALTGRYEILNFCHRSDDSMHCLCSDIPYTKLPNPQYDVSSLEQEISSADIDQLKVNLPS